MCGGISDCEDLVPLWGDAVILSGNGRNMDKRLLAILRCPVTHKELSLASGPTLKEVNAAA